MPALVNEIEKQKRVGPPSPSRALQAHLESCKPIVAPVHSPFGAGRRAASAPPRPPRCWPPTRCLGPLRARHTASAAGAAAAAQPSTIKEREGGDESERSREIGTTGVRNEEQNLTQVYIVGLNYRARLNFFKLCWVWIFNDELL